MTLCPTPPIKPKHYRPDIDGLRAVAILSVVLFHTFPSSLSGGFIGVDVFFVISGYLISAIIFRAFEKGTFSFWDFYARRIRRIFPALTFLLIGVLLLGSFILTPQEYKDLGRQVLYGSAFGENFFLIKNSGGYWDSATEMKPLMHLWTLAVEEQYYILYPFICWLVWRLKKSILKVLCFLWLISFSLFLYQNFTSPIVTFFSLHTRFWELCTGCILAAVFFQPETSFFKKVLNKLERIITPIQIQDVGSIFGLGCIFAGLMFATGQAKLHSLFITLPVFGAALIISTKNSWLNRKIFSSPPFVFVGLISYTWYLWHWPLLSIARNVNGGELPSFETCTLLLFAGLVLSLFSYYIIETPIRKKPITKGLSLVLCLCVIGCATIGIMVRNKDGFPSRVGENAVVTATMSYVFPSDNEYARKKFGCPEGSAYCWAPEKSEPEIALIGDSHAHHLAKGLNRVYGQPFLLIGHPGTPPVRNLICLKREKAKETPFMTQFLDIVDKEPKIKTVILSSRWDLFTSDFNIPYLWKSHKNESDRLKVLELLLEETIRDLLKHNKKVIIFLDVPENPLNTSDCTLSRPFFKGAGRCAFSEKEGEKIQVTTNAVIRKVVKKFPSVVLYDPTNVFCKKGNCSIRKGDVMLYRDDNHLSEAGSRMVIEDFLRNNSF